MAQLFDHYNFRARLQPALITLLPLALAAVAWVGPEQPWISAVWTLCATGGGTYFLAALVRNRGKEVEPDLWRSWGGSPTTRLLRHSGPANGLMRARWHARLCDIMGRPMPTASEEAEDLRRADEAYEAATKLLIGRTRSRENYPLLYKENVNYGFCRNLYAMRTAGTFIAAVGAIGSASAAVWFGYQGRLDAVPLACCFVSVVLLWGWLFRIRPSWVRVPAYAYAERLLESIDAINP